MRSISLTQGKVALVSDEDYQRVSHYKWTYHSRGYAFRNIRHNDKTTTELLHRFIMQPQNGLVIDHIDHDRLNNTRENLRICTQRQNTQNMKPKGKTKYKGVSWSKQNKKWYAYMRINGKSTSLGYYNDILDAAKAYEQAATKYHGEYAYGATK